VIRALGIAFAVVAGLVLLVALAIGGWLLAVRHNAQGAEPQHAGTIATEPPPATWSAMRDLRQAAGAASLGAEGLVLFGDLHVHTTFSGDAFRYSLPIFQGAGARPPADACDFARFCSQLDFWSINDHAETLSKAQWDETVRSVRACDAASGRETVPFLGWEWSQGGLPGAAHVGHKNVVLRDLDPAPPRPISSLSPGNFAHLTLGIAQTRGSLDERWSGLHRMWWDALSEPDCPPDTDPWNVPKGCRLATDDPAELFAGLDRLDLPALVIPHGLSWGLTNPASMDLREQLASPRHDPARQRLVEVYSGHGSSEVFAALPSADAELAEPPRCAAPDERREPCCWRAGELARARCTDPSSEACEAEVGRVRAEVLSAKQGLGGFTNAWMEVVPGTTTEDYGDCDQLKDAFLPAYDYRPRGSAQYALGAADLDAPGEPGRWRVGFIGSSDNHSARPGTGVKEFGRLENTEGAGNTERGASYFFTGGLAAVHAPSRDRAAIFDALHRREVYGTSGDRILLFLHASTDEGTRHPMGSELATQGDVRFHVRAYGAFVQKPGCPTGVVERLGPERLDWLCMNECYHPSDRRKPITRIEVVRIRPQASPDEAVADLIEDPWGSGCRVTFTDEERPWREREVAYYVRAIQAPSDAVNGDPLRCDRDEAGRCVRARLCAGDGTVGSAETDDCLAPVEERAWSSPIWIAPTRTVPLATAR
jgi:hypothetical protein